jgi:hypothetical protein
VVLVFLLTSDGRSLGTWLDSWIQWDSRWYEFTWENGYPEEDPRNLVFPPGYSVIVGTLSVILRLPFHRAGLLINCICFLATAVVFCRFCARRFDLPVAALLPCFLSSPPSYFCFPAYSDALFNALAWVLIGLASLETGNLTGARRWIVLTARPALAFVLPWFRLTGFALLAWVILRKWYVLSILASLALWLLLNRAIAGDFLYFLEAQELFIMKPGGFFTGLAGSVDRAFAGPDQASPDAWRMWLANDVLPIIYLVALIAVAVWLLRRKHGLLAVTTLSVLAMSYNQIYWRSVVRYDWLLMPLLFLPLLDWAFRAKAKTTRILAWLGVATLGLVQFVLQIWYARTFLAGHWAF